MTDTTALRAIGAVRVLAELAGVEWRREGSWQVARCPFHDDASASFKVGSRAPHRGRCFSCGAGGDVVELMAKVWGVAAGDAMRRLALQYQLEADTSSQPEQRPPPDQAAEPAVPPAHAALYRRALELATLEPVAEYLQGRGVLEAARAAVLPDGLHLVAGVPGDRVSEWSRRVAGDQVQTWRQAGGGALYRVGEAALTVLLFGTLALDGATLAGLHVRVLDPPPGAPRYLQMGADPRPWRRPGHTAPGPVVVCEGAVDALSWEAAGVQAIGLHGVETWRPWYVDAAPAGAELVIALDRDAAGRRAQARIASTLAQTGRPVGVVDLDADGPADANAALQAGGSAALLAVLATARPFEPPGGGRGAEGRRAPSAPPAAARARREAPPPAAPVAPREGEHEHLHELIEAAHWQYDDRRGDLVRVAVVQPAHQLTDQVIAWVEARGGVFLRDDGGGAWLYYRGRLLRVDVRDPAWRGWLYDVGRVILTDREGKSIASALEQYALSREHAPTPRPWLWHDRDQGTIALHLHDTGDQVALVTADGVGLEQNGRGPVLLLRDDATRAIPLRGARQSAEWAVSALEDLIVRGLACDPAQRSLVVSWGLTAALRHRLDTKAILFLTGAAGAGKTEAARLLTTLWHGAPRVLQTTVAALWAEGERQPLVALDNQESAQLAGNEGLQQWLLVAATGAQRTKRTEGTATGTLAQRADALALVTAIEPPALDELIQRTLLIKFAHRLHSADYSSAAVVADLQRHRGRLVGGLLELLAHQVLPRLGELRAITALIPPGHPKRRLGQHLALCALVADACHQVRPSIWGPGRAELAGWLEAQATASTELARGSDPVLDALQRLLWDWNRVTPTRGGGLDHFLVRAAADDARYRCTPLYRTAAGEWSTDEGDAHDQVRGGFGRVTGVSGSYTDLHADLLRVCRDTGAGTAFARRIGTPSVLAARWSHNAALQQAGWTAEPVSRSGRGGRIYRFASSPEEEGA